MRFPVNDGSKEKFEKLFYIADGFGTNRGTYYHSGADINLRTGGDSDLGVKLYAIADGKKRYYHFGSHPTTGYGIHHVYQIEGPWGTRWVHYAHNQPNPVIKDKTDFPEGEWLSNIGKSGTGFAHLHLSIFKVDPSTLRKGIDTIPRTRTELNEWWEDPINFINKWYAYVPPQEEEGYTVVYKGEVIAKYDTNPVDEINKLNKKIEAQGLIINGINQELAIAKTMLDEQEKDNAILIEELRRVTRERDDCLVANRQLLAEKERLEEEVEDLSKKLEAKDPLSAYTKWELFMYIFGKR